MDFKEIKRDLFTMTEDYYLAHCISSDAKMGAGIAAEINPHTNPLLKLLYR
ncbi:hypothetical protein EV294_105133 [Paenibacillus sp. BK033]|uniref:hypothetical protein n=1 Tax=Paenibacillus sp. BK033 TaxID=2512133 RepID=UPI0010DC3913|nr:hypothetical protein [Paenibacillus sp. BK033]TCM96268.1 hypothetical protein EV294_105133 [Paenibacillus sp. BK033]